MLVCETPMTTWTSLTIAAALGGTLSSYTWICMILNFLQTRKPPILPSLQQQPGIPATIIGGVNVAFDHNIKRYRGFGSANTDSLGSLIFQFFRYYGHELDFEHAVMSVRLGKVTTKSEKGWNLLQDNRLCVEEPFNIGRNLANTADDTSMRGIHIELRRAFRKLAEGDLEGCCEQYVRPQEEGRSVEIFLPPSGPRPVMARAPAQTMRAPKTNAKGARHLNGSNRGPNAAGRRTSNPQSRGPYHLRNLPFPMNPHELQMQQQHQQHILHDELFRQYQYLQMQEQELRLQLQLQAVAQGRVAASNSYPHIAFPSHSASENEPDEPQTSSASGNHSTMSAPLRQQRFGYTSPFLPFALPHYGMVTNPSSPLLATAMPDLQRNPRRTSVTRSSAGASNRAHSQPARSLQSPLLYMHPAQYATPAMVAGQGEHANGRRSPMSSHMQERAPMYIPIEPASLQYRQGSARSQAEYMGHYIGPTPPIPAYSRSAGISPAPTQVGLAIQNGGLSPGFFSRMPSYSPAAGSPPSQPISDSGEDFDLMRSRGLSSPLRPGSTSNKGNCGPLVVNGSLSDQSDPESPGIQAQEHEMPAALSVSASEDLAFDTPSSSDDQSHDQFSSTYSGGQIRTKELHKEVKPIGRPDDLKSTTTSDTNRSAVPMSTHATSLKTIPLSPVREDPVAPQFPVEATTWPGLMRTPSLSPAMKRMIIPEIPSFSSLQQKKMSPEALSIRTNGVPTPLADTPLPIPALSPVT